MENLEHWCFSWYEVATSQGSDRGALLSGERWDPRSAITIGFLDGTPALHRRVERVAKEWTARGLANLSLVFDSARPAKDIRISFTRPGSWSVIGASCGRVGASQPTMNFGWLTEATDELILRRVVLHEFGHALGLVHEHQHPGAAIQWDRDAVYRDLEPGWSRAQIDKNIFDAYASHETNSSRFDASSIMLYPIKKGWTVDGFSSQLNTQLSTVDMEFIAECYP
jgi:serralysin